MTVTTASSPLGEALGLAVGLAVVEGGGQVLPFSAGGQRPAPGALAEGVEELVQAGRLAAAAAGSQPSQLGQVGHRRGGQLLGRLHVAGHHGVRGRAGVGVVGEAAHRAAVLGQVAAARWRGSPSRSRTVLTYSVRVSSRSGDGPGSRSCRRRCWAVRAAGRGCWLPPPGLPPPVDGHHRGCHRPWTGPPGEPGLPGRPGSPPSPTRPGTGDAEQDGEGQDPRGWTGGQESTRHEAPPWSMLPDDTVIRRGTRSDVSEVAQRSPLPPKKIEQASRV